MTEIDRPPTHEIGDEYIMVEEAAAILNMTPRSATRYAPKVRHYRAGSRIMYHRADVEALANKMNARARPRKSEIQRREITELSRSVGRLEGEIVAQQRQIDAQRLELEQAQQLRIQLALTEAELERTRAELLEVQHRAGLPDAAPSIPLESDPIPARQSWLRRLLGY